MRRENNEEADVLSKLGSYRQAIPAGISLEHLRKPSIKPSPESESIFIPAKPEPDVILMDVDVGCVTENPGTGAEVSGTHPVMPEEPVSANPMEIDEPVPLCMVRPTPKWAEAIMTYMENGNLPSEEVLARQVQRRSKAYTIFKGELHKRSATTVLQRCVEPTFGILLNKKGDIVPPLINNLEDRKSVV